MSDNNTTTTPAASAAPAPNDMHSLTDSIRDNLLDLGPIVEKAITPKTDEPVEHKAKSSDQFIPPVVDRRPKTPAEAAKPETADPLDALEPDKSISELGKNNFGKLREAYKATKAERETLKREAEELRQQLEITKKTSTTAPTADYESLKAEHQKVLDHLAKVDLQAHPEFLAKYVAPRDAALAEAAEVLAYNDKKADLPSLLGKGTKELNGSLAELTKGMNAVDAATVINGVRTAAKYDQRAQEELKNAKTSVEQLGQRAVYQSKAEFEGAWKDSGIGAFLSKHEIPPTVDATVKAELEAYNSGVDNVRVMAEKYAFGSLSPRDAALVAQKAAFADFASQHAFPAVGKALQRLQSEKQALEQEVASLKVARSSGVPTGNMQVTKPNSARYSSSGLAQEDMAENIASLLSRNE